MSGNPPVIPLTLTDQGIPTSVKRFRRIPNRHRHTPSLKSKLTRITYVNNGLITCPSAVFQIDCRTKFSSYERSLTATRLIENPIVGFV